MGVSICLNFLVKACQNGREKVPPVCASFRPEEDVDGGGALQARQRPYQSQRPPAPPRRTQDVEAEARGAAVAPRQRPLLCRRHPRQGQRRRAHRSSVCHPSSHFQVPRRLLPKVRRRSFEEGNQGYPHFLRSLPSRRGSQAERAEKVRRTRSQSPLPEIVSLTRLINLRLDPTHFCALLYVSTSSSSLVVVPIPSVRRCCFRDPLS